MARSWTPEQRKAQGERLRAIRDRRAAVKAGTYVAPPEPPSKDEAAEEFKALAAELYRVAGDKAERERKLDEVEHFLGRLTAKDYPELAQSEVVMKFIDQLASRQTELNRDDPPGTIYNRGMINERKKIWTENDLSKSDIAKIEFEVNEPELVIWNGIRRDYEPGVTYNDYRCFPDLIREKRRNLRLAHEHAEYLFRMRNTLTDPSMAGFSTARVRGSADSGSFRPGAGLFVPGQADSGEEAE